GQSSPPGGCDNLPYQLIYLPRILSQNLLHSALSIKDDRAQVVADARRLLGIRFPEEESKLLSDCGDVDHLSRGKAPVLRVGLESLCIRFENRWRVKLGIEREREQMPVSGRVGHSFELLLRRGEVVRHTRAKRWVSTTR